MKKKYWAVGCNYDYDILLQDEHPDQMIYGSIDGPFKTLKQAKKRALYWLKTDREHLQVCRKLILSIKLGRGV